jgi:hypothetical protein
MNALILRTNGTRELKKLSDDDIAEPLGCRFIERMPHTKGYRHPKGWSKGTGSDKEGTLRYLSCWVDEEGFCAQKPNNGYAGVLMALNVTMSMGYAVFGDVVIFSRSRTGSKDAPIDPYVVDLCQQYEECEDEDAFFCALEKLNGSGFGGNDAPKIKKSAKSKKAKKVKPPSNNNNNRRADDEDCKKRLPDAKNEDEGCESVTKKSKNTD